MVYEFRLPDIGEGVAQGEVVKWHVRAGDPVKEDQPLVSVLTDKANVEIPCPVTGKVIDIHAKEGEMVKVGGLLITFEAAGGASLPKREEHAAPQPAPPVKAAASAPEATSPGGGRIVAAPSLRRRANELHIDLSRVRGTGPGGRITDSDLDNHQKNAGQEGQAVREQFSASVSAIQTAPPAIHATAAQPLLPQVSQLQERVPIRGLRRTIAEHMVLAKERAAHYTYVEEVNVSELVRVRERSKKRFEEAGVPLTYLSFIVKSVVKSLKEHPRLNALMDDGKGELVLCHYYHIGIASATPEGLIVPVVKDADRKSITTIAKEIEYLSQRGRAGKLTREELTGSTFTITSLGTLGGLLATPILNYPEVAILGVHKIERRPIVLPDGSFAAAHMMNLSISLDHRVVDGYDGARFIAAVKGRLEDPHQLLLELK